jgi:outer membrane immunogenic protein
MLAGSAVGADLSRREAEPVYTSVPRFTWTGFYAGVHAGYAATANSTNSAPGGERGDDGFIGGGQIGFNYALQTMLLGIEADISSAGLKQTFQSTDPRAQPATFEQSLRYLGTLRGRFGLAVYPFLVYATGGIAYGEVSYRGISSESRMEMGYTVGVGVEYALMSNITLKGEYLGFFDLGRENITIQGNTPESMAGHILRVGANYKF